MLYKKDWDEAETRLSAWWRGERLDRPCLQIHAPRDAGDPPPLPSDPEAVWLDADFVIRQGQSVLESCAWLGESIPSHILMGGWALGFGAPPQFSEVTIWLDAIPVNYEATPAFELNNKDPYLIRYRQVYDAWVQHAGRDNFLVGRPYFMPANDLLAGILGPEAFLTALVDHPQWMQSALAQLTDCFVTLLHEFRERAGDHRFPIGHGGWMAFWAPEPMATIQSDVSCMLSPAMYDEFIVPGLVAVSRALGPLWYHVDGYDARRHLPTLLSMPEIKVIQYTPDPHENGNGMHHLELYRQILDAGKLLHIEVPAHEVQTLLANLDASRVMLRTGVPEVRAGHDMLAAAAKFC